MMFEQFFKQPCALLRQRNAPLASERASFLAQRAEEGAAPGTLVRLARELLVVVQELDLANNHVITPSRSRQPLIAGPRNKNAGNVHIRSVGRGSFSDKPLPIGCGS